MPLCNVISGITFIDPFSKLGTGNVVCICLNICVCKITIILLLALQINHDTVVGSHCYFSAGVTVAGK